MSQQYPEQGSPGPEYNQQGQSYENYETNAPPGVPQGPTPGPAGDRKKRRNYAGQAYEFGAGGNAALGGQQQAGGAYGGGYSGQQDAAGYPQGGYQQTPAAVQQGQTPMYGNQEGAGYPGYQAAGQQGYQQPGTPNVAGVTQQFGQLDMSQKPTPAPQQAQQQPGQPQQGRPQALNQLYPTDLQNQPFNVAELDYPPPPAILPPNVSGGRDLAPHRIC